MKYYISRALVCTLALVSAPFVASAQVETPSPAPMATEAPATAEPSTSAPMRTMAPEPRATEKPQYSYKKIKTGSLTLSQMAYGLTHQVSEAKQLASMKKINFDNLRVVKLPAVLKLRYHVYAPAAIVAYEPLVGLDAMLAQSAPPMPNNNGNNSPVQYLHNVLANINVSNALNNILNNSNVNVAVSLSNVLNNNKIAIGQVVGIYVGGGGLINTIVN